MKKKLILSLLFIGAIGGGSNAFPYKHLMQSENLILNNFDQDNKANALKTVYTCPMHPEIVQDKPGKCPKCGMDLIGKDVSKDVYTCPMHPEIVQDKPGKCPKCGMGLTVKKVSKDVYSCPMHPEVVQDKQGKCPKCGMNLTLKESPKKPVPSQK